MKWFFYGAVLAIAAPFCGAATLNLAYSSAPGSLVEESARYFAHVVETRSHGQIRIRVSRNSDLGLPPLESHMIRALKDGGGLGLDIVLSIHTRSSSKTIASQLEVFDLPYLVGNRRHAQDIARNILSNQNVATAALENKVVIIGIWEYGFRNLSSSKKGIRDPRDLRGLRISTPGGPWSKQMFERFGALPVAIPATEVRAALRSGVIDARDGTPASFLERKLYSAQKYYSLTSHVFVPAYLLMNRSSFSRLNNASKGILSSAAIDTSKFVLTKAEELEQRDLNNVRRHGVIVVRVAQETFQREVTRIYDDFAEKVPGGYELIGRAIRLR